VTVAPGAGHVDLALRASLRADRRIAGRVLEHSAPVVARISLRRSGPPRLLLAGRDGRFAFGDLAAGSYTLEARALDGGWATAEVEAGQEDLAIALRPDPDTGAGEALLPRATRPR
jgi:hypothetical protein